MYDDAFTIETPENVIFGYQIAGLGSRFLATLVDSVLLGVLLALVTLVTGGIAALILDGGFDGEGIVLAFFVILNFIFFWGYYIFFELAWNGQTPGKRVYNLRTLGHDGTPLTLSASLIRNLVRIVDFLPVAYGLGVVVMFVSKRGLRLGDFAAGTIVVHDRNVSLQELQAARFTPASIDNNILLELPVERLTQEDLALAESYLARRDELTTKHALIRPVLQRLYDRMEQPLEEVLNYTEAVSRLEQIVAAARGDVSAADPAAASNIFGERQ